MFWYGKKIRKNREGITGYHVFCRTFLSHSAKKTRRGTLPCSKKCLAIKRFIHRRGSIIGLSDFPLSRSRKKNSLGGTLFFRNVLFWKNFFWLRGKVSRFSVDFFCLTVPKKSQRKPSVFRKFLVMKNFRHRRGAFTVLSEMICFTLRKRTVAGHLFSRNVLVWKTKIGETGRVSRILSNIFVSQCQKNS